MSGDGREYAYDRFAENAERVDVLLRIALELNARVGEVAQVNERLVRALPGESVERPEEQQIESVLRHVEPHLLEAGALAVLCRGFVNVFSQDGPAVPIGELAELEQLIERVLALVVGRDTGVDRDFSSVFHL